MSKPRKLYSIQCKGCRGWSSPSPAYRMMFNQFAKGAWSMLRSLSTRPTVGTTTASSGSLTDYRFVQVLADGTVVEELEQLTRVAK